MASAGLEGNAQPAGGASLFEELHAGLFESANNSVHIVRHPTGRPFASFHPPERRHGNACSGCKVSLGQTGKGTGGSNLAPCRANVIAHDD